MKFYLGIFKGGIIKSCQNHELYLREKLAAGESPQQLYQWHLQKLAWLQHERLIHLLVTIATGLLLLFTVGMGCYTHWCLEVWPFLLIFFSLLAAYLWHYYRLENRVLHWYKLAEWLHRLALVRQKQDKRVHQADIYGQALSKVLRFFA
jgi:hypothetical protein